MDFQSKTDAKVKQLLKENGLDYEIQKLPMEAKGQNGENIETPYFGIYNPKHEKFLYSSKESYRVTQNEEIVKAIVEGTKKFANELDFYSVKDINYGSKLIANLEIQGNEKFGNDKMKRFISIMDSNDGSIGLKVGVGFLVYSCTNGLYMFKGDENSFNVKSKHTQSIEGKIHQLSSMVEGYMEKSFSMLDKFKQFQSTKVSRELVHELSSELLGVSKAMTEKEMEKEGVSTRKTNQMEALYRNMETELNSKGENLWGLLNGVTRWTTHEKSAPNRENGRIESMTSGSNYKTNMEALEFVENKYRELV